MGNAAPARIERIVTVTINSTSVSPCSPGRRLRIGRASFIDRSLIALLHLNVDPRTLGRHLLLSAGHRPRTGENEVAPSRGLGLETEDAHHARSAHPGRS